MTGYVALRLDHASFLLDYPHVSFPPFRATELSFVSLTQPLDVSPYTLLSRSSLHNCPPHSLSRRSPFLSAAALAVRITPLSGKLAGGRLGYMTLPFPSLSPSHSSCCLPCPLCCCLYCNPPDFASYHPLHTLFQPRKNFILPIPPSSLFRLPVPPATARCWLPSCPLSMGVIWQTKTERCGGWRCLVPAPTIAPGAHTHTHTHTT